MSTHKFDSHHQIHIFKTKYIHFFPGMVSDNIREWYDFLDETQLVILATAGIVFDYPKHLFPNVISVEGLTAKDAKPLTKGKHNQNKKVLRDHKRHTARCVSSPAARQGVWTDAQTRVKTLPSPILRMRAVINQCSVTKAACKHMLLFGS